MTPKLLTAVSAFDIHFPHTDMPTWNAILDFTKKNKVGLFVFGGDNLDCGSISHHNKNKPMYRTRGGMKADLDGFRKTILDPIEKLLPKDCIKVFCHGNHENWVQQMFEEQPELEGMVDIAGYLGLRERGWIIVPQGGHFKRGKLKWIHGDVLTGGQAAPRKALDTFVESVIFGHFHAFASATKVLPGSPKHKWQAWSTGCVGKLDAGYLKNRPTGWLNGFSITEFYGNQGFFNNYPVTVIGGRFAYAGKLYGRQ